MSIDLEGTDGALTHTLHAEKPSLPRGQRSECFRFSISLARCASGNGLDGGEVEETARVPQKE